MAKKTKPVHAVTERLMQIQEIVSEIITEVENGTHPRSIRMLKILRPLSLVLPILIKLSIILVKTPKA